MIQPPSPYRLRKLTVNDIADVLAIERVSLPSARKESVYYYELARNSLAHYQALVKHEPVSDDAKMETLLGYAGYWKIADEIHISMIAVAPVWRGQGLGELLLLNLLFLALREEATLVTLEVRVSNQVAQNLYRKYLFDEVGLRRRYYKDTGEDAILMTVDLLARPDYESFLKGQQTTLFEQLAPTL